MLSTRPVALGDDPYHAKTPGRAVRDRSTLQENVHRGLMTIHAKGKTLQTPRVAGQSHKAFAHTAKPAVRVQRPLGDKTPFPNRVVNALPFGTPAPQTGKLAKLSLLEAPVPQEIVPGSLLRPSSARKSLRAPRTSDGARQLEFKTPVTRGDHWNVSDGDIEPSDGDVEEVVEAKDEDYGEIEYMPPTAIAAPYEPPFEMPDYTKLGESIRQLVHSHKFDDRSDIYYSLDIAVTPDAWKASGFESVENMSGWPKLDLTPLENEVLTLRKTDTQPSHITSSPIAAKQKATSSQPSNHSKSITATRVEPAGTKNILTRNTITTQLTRTATISPPASSLAHARSRTQTNIARAVSVGRPGTSFGVLSNSQSQSAARSQTASSDSAPTARTGTAATTRPGVTRAWSFVSTANAKHSASRTAAQPTTAAVTRTKTTSTKTPCRPAISSADPSASKVATLASTGALRSGEEDGDVFQLDGSLEEDFLFDV